MEGSSEENDSHGKSQHGHHSTITTVKNGSDTLGRSQLSQHLHTTADTSSKPGYASYGDNHDPIYKPVETNLELNEDTSCLLSAAAECNQSVHLIDTSAYVPPEMDEKTENLMSLSICIADPKDPFDTETIEKFLNMLQRPLSSYDNYNAVDEYLPEFSKGIEVFLGRL